MYAHGGTDDVTPATWLGGEAGLVADLSCKHR